MSVYEAVEAELGELEASGSLAAMALAMASEIDAGNSLTSKTLASKEIRECLRELRALSPPKRQEDRVDEIRQRRERRVKRAAG